MFLSFYDPFLPFAVYWPAGSTLVAVEPRAFETMSKALTRNTNCHPYKDAAGAVLLCADALAFASAIKSVHWCLTFLRKWEEVWHSSVPEHLN